MRSANLHYGKLWDNPVSSKINYREREKEHGHGCGKAGGDNGSKKENKQIKRKVKNGVPGRLSQ